MNCPLPGFQIDVEVMRCKDVPEVLNEQSSVTHVLDMTSQSDDNPI